MKGITKELSGQSGNLVERKIAANIITVRGSNVILDSDLARLYGVETRRLNEQVRRNISRFPEDFMFQLTEEEYGILMSQNATTRSNWGGRRKLPLVFTEHGALQAANVLNSEQANRVSVFIIRVFVKLRQLLLSNEVLSRKLEKLEERVNQHDTILVSIVEEIRNLIEPPKPKQSDPIGFRMPKATEKEEG